MTAQRFTVDARDLLTVHKAGCLHLRAAEAADLTFDVEAEPSRAAVLEQLDEYAMGGDIEDVVAFGPCLRDLT